MKDWADRPVLFMFAGIGDTGEEGGRDNLTEG